VFFDFGVHSFNIGQRRWDITRMPSDTCARVEHRCTAFVFLHIAVHSSGIGHSHVLNAAMNNVLVLVLTMGTHQGPNLPPPDVYRGVGVCVFHHVVSRDMMENTYPHTPTTSGAKFGPGWPQRMQCRTPQGLPEIPPTSSVNTSGRHRWKMVW
jgi:hypothetical protein